MPFQRTSGSRSPRRYARVSVPLLVATGLSVGLQACVLLPGLRDVFQATPLDTLHFALVGACSIAVAVVVEVAKLIDRRVHAADRGAGSGAKETRVLERPEVEGSGAG